MKIILLLSPVLKFTLSSAVQLSNNRPWHLKSAKVIFVDGKPAV